MPPTHSRLTLAASGDKYVANQIACGNLLLIKRHTKQAGRAITPNMVEATMSTYQSATPPGSTPRGSTPERRTVLFDDGLAEVQTLHRHRELA